MQTFLEIDVAEAICSLFEQLFRHSGISTATYTYGLSNQPYSGEAMVFVVGSRFTYEERIVNKISHLVLCGDSTHVWWQMSDDEYDSEKLPLEQWINMSNHDSGWKTSGVERALTRMYFEGCEQCAPGQAPEKVSTFTTLGGWLPNKPVKMAHITFEKSGDYQYRLLSLDPYQMPITFKMER